MDDSKTRFGDPSWWDMECVEHGVGPLSAHFSEKSHKIRASVVGRLMGCGEGLSVLDLGCGTGFLEKELGPFGSYHGVDFSIEALKVNGRTRKTIDANYSKSDVVDFTYSCEKKSDVVISIGVMCFEHIFKTEDVVIGYISDCSDLVNDGGVLIVDFPWGDKHDEGIKTYSIDRVAEILIGNGREFDIVMSKLTHQFFVVVHA